ncbi:MAG: nucleotide pyrophosphohydrolase [Planctomycetota bacterium]|nr:nucleotide pyrophosphohydrolase [Planctomycetota bacterium]
MDRQNTFADLKARVTAFRDARDWARFHRPKDLAAALAIEAGELQELFLWKSHEEIDALLATEAGRARLEEELADVQIFLLHLAVCCGVDVSEAVARKLANNEAKYPVDKSRGSAKKYTELERTGD